MSPMAGKSWQPSHEPPCRKGKKAPITLKKQWKEGGKGWGKLPGWWAVTSNNAANTCLKHMQECLQWRAHGIQTHAHMQKTRERWMLFVVNSLKLHLKKRMQCMQFNVKSAILPISFPYNSLKLGWENLVLYQVKSYKFFLCSTFYQFVEWIMF